MGFDFTVTGSIINEVPACRDIMPTPKARSLASAVLPSLWLAGPGWAKPVQLESRTNRGLRGFFPGRLEGGLHPGIPAPERLAQVLVQDPRADLKQQVRP